MARARMADGNAAVHLLKLMNPAELSRSPEDVTRYRGEPYVVAADVGASPGKMGRSGWTWYTGSAGWMYRIWVEEVLGFKLRGDTLTLKPSIPDDWPTFRVTYRHRSAKYEIVVTRDAAVTGATVDVDGGRADDGVIHLDDDGKIHHVAITIGSARPPVAAILKPVVSSSSNGSFAVKLPSPKTA